MCLSNLNLNLRRILMVLFIVMTAGIMAQALEGEKVLGDTVLLAGEQVQIGEYPFRTVEIRWRSVDIGKLVKGVNPLWSTDLKDSQGKVICTFRIETEFDGTRYGFNDDMNENRIEILSVSSLTVDGNWEDKRFPLTGFTPERYTTMKLVFDGRAAIDILCGAEKYKRIGRTEVANRPFIGEITAYKPLDISTINLSPLKSVRDSLMTDWTEEVITVQEEGGLGGLYIYLDSELETKKVAKGGDYQLYLLPTAEKGFDIIYYDGALANQREWQRGMLKGRLRPTIFENHYNVEWYDARFNSDYEECWGEFQPGPILTLHFPVESSVLRFYRKPVNR